MKKIFLLMIPLIISCKAPGIISNTTLQSKLESEFEEISNKYGLNVNYYGNKKSVVPISFQILHSLEKIESDNDLNALDKYMENVFIEEINKYPINFFRDNKVSSITIGKNLATGKLFYKSEVGGIANSSIEGKFAIIDLPKEYFSNPDAFLLPGSKNNSQEYNAIPSSFGIDIYDLYFKGTIHHEIFHTIDKYFDDSEWISLNPEGAKYDTKFDNRA